MAKAPGIPLIELENVGRSYGSKPVFWALKDVSVTINEGEFVAIMGPSGSGKSTMMSIIGCLDKPSEGIYRLKGKNIRSYKDGPLSLVRNQTIGFVFQQFNLIPRLSVLSNVMTPVLYGGMPQARQRALAILDSVGLREKAHSKPNELSGGQRQRVAIARALMMDPDVILADEPTGNLDSKSGVQVMKLLQELHREGKTVVVITHDPEIAKYAKRVLMIRDGHVTEDARHKGGTSHG